MPKLLSLSTVAGLEVLAAYNSGPRYVEADTVEHPVVLGSFFCSLDTSARLEVVAALLSATSSGRAYLYDATAIDDTFAREVQGSSVAISGAAEARFISPAFALKAGHNYQIRAACIDATPAGRGLVVQGAAPVDA